MRTIKFRGKKISNSKWINGYYIVDPMGKSQILHNFVFHTVITETVGQFTGLTDLNGREIFEGDIVHIGPRGQVWSVEYDESEARFIVFNQINSDRSIELNFEDQIYSCGEKLVSPVKVQVTEDYSFGLAVIGNIHDNHELVSK